MGEDRKDDRGYDRLIARRARGRNDERQRKLAFVFRDSPFL